jgi:hypothetical protein
VRTLVSDTERIKRNEKAVAALALGGVAKVADFPCLLIDQKGNGLN